MWSRPETWSMGNFTIEAGGSRNNSRDRLHFDGEIVPNLGADVEDSSHDE